MDIQVAKFREALGLLKLVVPRKAKIESLTSVMVKDKQLVGTNLETMVVVPLPEAGDMACLIPYDGAVKTIQYIPGAEMLHVELKDGGILMSWSDGSMNLNTKKVEDFPAVPEYVSVAEAPLDADTLIPTMASVVGYAATEESRPVLSELP